jgi:hypothetical protein
MILRLILIQFLLVNFAFGQNVFSIAIIGNDDKTRENDLEQFSLICKDIANNLNYPLKVSQLTGTRFTVKNTRETLQNLKLNSNDIVIVYYSGKGNIEDERKWPQFNFKEEDLPMRDVSAIIKSKKPKLFLIIGDCDQKDYVPDFDFKSMVVLHPAAENQNFKTIFTDFKGRTSIQISSTSVGQGAKRDKRFGSVFLKEFKSAFENETNSETTSPSWNNIREQTIKKVQLATNNSQKPKFSIEVLSDVEDE